MRFSIGKKITLGFGILIFLNLIVFSATYFTVSNTERINTEINTVNTPSIKRLQELKFRILETRIFLETWVKEPKENRDKQRLIEFREHEYPRLKEDITLLSENWSSDQKDSLVKLYETIEYLFEEQSISIIYVLQEFEDYESNIFAILNARASMEEGGKIYMLTYDVLGKLDSIIDVMKNNSDEQTKEVFIAFSELEFLVKLLGVALVIIGILVAAYTTRSIVRPINRLKRVAIKLGRGVFPTGKMAVSNDEIGEMTAAVNNVVEGLKNTKDFANAIGSGNFEVDYQPLSSKDTLSLSLLKMRDDLAESERELEDKVKKRTAEVIQQKEEINEQKAQIEKYFNQVTDSIRYAKRIQEAILPPINEVNKILPNSFILYKPKDIVSGDFYWLAQVGNKVFFAAVDCTGHGVPGAFMSIVGYNQLKQAITNSKAKDPATILDYLNEGVTEALRQRDVDSKSSDGMDMAICSIDFETLEMEYAGAYNPLYLLRDGEITETKGDKFPIGSLLGGVSKKFTNHKIQLKKGDHIYIFSDGYADQFGGTRGKKFMYKRFRETLIEFSHLDMFDQRSELNRTITEWMVNEDQVDDILVIGLKV